MLTLAHESKSYNIKSYKCIPYKTIECTIVYQVAHCSKQKMPLQVEVLGYKKSDKLKSKPDKLYIPNIDIKSTKDLYQNRWKSLDKWFKDNYPISNYTTKASIKEDDKLQSISKYTTCLPTFKKKVNC